jgi:hypothetical protein
MRTFQYYLGIVAICTVELHAGCNSLVGVGNVSLTCYLAPTFGKVTAGAGADYTSDDGHGNFLPDLSFSLDSRSMLELVLYSDFAPGTYTLTEADGNGNNCNICWTLDINGVRQAFDATGQGTLTLNTVNRGQLSGTMIGLTFDRVSANSLPPSDTDGCPVLIDEVDFDILVTNSAP